MICPECKQEIGDDETEKLHGVEYCCPCYVKLKGTLTPQDVYRLMGLCVAYEGAVAQYMEEFRKIPDDGRSLPDEVNPGYEEAYSKATKFAESRDALQLAIRTALGITTETGYETREQ